MMIKFNLDNEVELIEVSSLITDSIPLDTEISVEQ